MRAAAMGALAVWLGGTACAGQAAGGRKSKGPLDKGEAVRNSGAVEPSGIAYHGRLGHLFVVGDEGTLAQLDGQGRLVHASLIGPNLEDVAVHTPSGSLVLLVETTGELIVYDPVARRAGTRWKIDTEALLGQRGDKRHGFEGLAFREEAGRPGGGVFYLAHQRRPAMLVAVAFEPHADPGGARTLGGEALLGRWKLDDHRDLTAVSWSESLQHLLVVADAEDTLLLVDPQGEVRGQVPLPGQNQEGVCLDSEGALWVADDRGARVVRHAGALSALQEALREGPPDPGGKRGKKGKKKKD